MKLKIIIIALLASLMIGICNAGIYEGISFEHEFEEIKIRTSYNSDYGESGWKITDNKELYIKLEILEQPDNVTIMIEHMHADVSIHAYKPEVDGLLQDTMDDKMHTGNQEGFYVSPTYPYYETFAVEGYSKFLIEGWDFLMGKFGYARINERRLDENNLKNVGAQGSEVVIVYDVLIRSAPDEPFHKRIVTDNFYIFFNGDFEPSSQQEEVKTTKTVWRIKPWATWSGILAVISFFGGLAVFFIKFNYHNLLATILLILTLVCICLVIGFRGISVEQVVVT